MQEADWREEMLAVVQAAPRATLNSDPKSVRDLEFDFLEVTYPEHPNTLQTLSRASDEVKNHTRLIVRPERETIQFKYTHKELTKEIIAEPLIQRILEEDIPVRRQFHPTYTIHDNCVIVQSPEILSVQLFENTLTRIWRLTGLYEKDGMYHQRFEQEKPSPSVQPVTADPVEKYGQYRLQHLSWSVSLSCPSCDGECQLKPATDTKEWTWCCNSCETEYGEYETLTSVLEPMNPLWTREKIREQIRDEGMNMVYG